MGVDLQTYRCRVGVFNGRHGSVPVCLPSSTNSSTVGDLAFGVMTPGTVWFIGALLLIAGIERNPGPPVSHYMNDQNFKNWVRAAYGFKYLKSGLIDFISNEICQHHNALKQMVAQQSTNVQPCSVCTSNNLLPDHGSQGCNHGNKRDCFCRQNPKTRRPCPNHICSTLYHHIVEDHEYKSPFLPKNKHHTQLNWYNDVYQYAKCYLTTATKATSLHDLDCAGFLSLVINNRYILNSIDDVKTFEQCRKDRNTVFHSGDFNVTGSELTGFIDNMILVLEDKKCLLLDQRAQHAVKSLKQLKNDNIHISDEDIVGIVQDATRGIRELSENVQQALVTKRQKILDEFNAVYADSILKLNKQTSDALQKVDERKDTAMKRLDERKDTALSEMKQKQLEGTNDAMKRVDERKDTALSEMKQKQLEGTNDAMKRVDERKDAALSEMKQKQLEGTNGAMKEVDERKDAALSEMKQVQHDVTSFIAKQKDDAINARKQEVCFGHKNIQEHLVQSYQQHCRTIPVSPLFDNKDEHLLKIYKMPTMYTEEQNKESKQISGYKDIFYKEGVSLKQVYVTGDAGVGKTSFCSRMCLVWSMTKSGDTLEKEDKELQKDLKFMCKFDFVFYINLRDTSQTHVIDMIVERFFNNSKEKYESAIESILRDESCLIILDSLDEWEPATEKADSKQYKVPERIYSDKCFCLTTCRPYRIEKVRLSHKKDVDHLIKITGLHGDSSQSYIEHVISYMNDEHSSNKHVDDFTDEVEKCGLTDQLCIPIFISHLVILWFEKKLSDMPRALIYANILEMVFKRAEKRNIKCPSAPTSTWQLPDSLSGMGHLNKYVCLLYNVCHLSFRALFKQDEHAQGLVFTRQQLAAQPYCLHREETDFLCDIGILSKNEVFGCFTEEKLKISFIHKSYMEFLAALFITSFDRRNLFSDITEQWGSLEEFLQFENIFILLAGLSFDRVKLLFENINVTLADDLSSCRCKAVFHYHPWEYKDRIKSLQTVVSKCYQEVSSCYNRANIGLKLEDFVFDDDNSDALVTSHVASLKQLFKSNCECVKSLFSVNGKYSVEFDQIKNLQCLRVGKIVPVDYAQFTQLVRDNASTLQTLCIEGDSDCPLIPQLPGISDLILRTRHRLMSCLPCTIRRRHNTSLQHLTSLSLCQLTMQHSSLHNLVKVMSNNIHIENIALVWIRCDDHWPDDDDCTFTLSLARHTKLTVLRLKGVNILCRHVNNSSLKSIQLFPCSKRNVSCYIDLLDDIKDSPIESLHIDGDNMLDSNTVDTLISTYKTLPCIELLILYDMNLYDGVLLPTHLDVIQVGIFLNCVTLSKECFHSFIESGANIEYAVLSGCKISSVDVEPCREMSVKESFEYMSEYITKKPFVNILHKDVDKNELMFKTI